MWRGLLLALNALLPVPTLALLFAGAAGAWWLLAFTLATHGLLLWAIMAPRAQWLGPLIHRLGAGEREVWLTIDDGPVGEKTRELSAALRERGVAATFFVIGSRLRAHPEAAEFLRRDGHALANHSETHPRKSFWCCPARIVRREVDGGMRALSAAGCASPWFRPPVGHKPPGLAKALREAELTLVTWDVGGSDGWHADPRPTVERVLAGVEPGSIIVLHEGRAHSNPTILAVVDALLAKGFRFVMPGQNAGAKTEAAVVS